jgi:hypothetical protein
LNASEFAGSILQKRKQEEKARIELPHVNDKITRISNEWDIEP